MELTRYFQKIFASNSASDQRRKFGSLAAGSPANATNPAEVQELANYLGGWPSAVIGNNSPALEDMNSLQYLFSYQLAYIMQKGIPEWETETTYYVGDIVSNGNGVIFVSKTDDNQGNALTDTSNWKVYQCGRRVISASDNVEQTDDYVICEHTGGSINVTLPAPASTPVGKKFTVKNKSSDGSSLVVVGTIDGNTNITLNSTPVFDSLTVMNNGTNYDIV